MSEYNPILTAPEGANKKPKRVGRGSSSGLGTTAGKGNKGQQSRSGGKTYVGFEGGQMPLYRRIAHKGFSNYPFKQEFVAINVGLLNDGRFKDGDTVDVNSLVEKDYISKKEAGNVKILGNGDLTVKLNVVVEKISASAKEKIEKAGGTVTIKQNEVSEKK